MEDPGTVETVEEPRPERGHRGGDRGGEAPARGVDEVQDLEIDGRRIRLEGIELSVVAATALPDLSRPLTEPDPPFPAIAT